MYIKAAVIGLGVGAHHARTLSNNPNCQLIWICDSNKNKLLEIGSEIKDAKQTQNDEDVLNDPDIDLICVASYDEAHHKQVLKALDNGKHVYVEKPMCLKTNEAKEIREKLKSKSSLRLSSNMVLRTCPLFIKVRENLEKKAMGKIYNIEADYLWGRKEKLVSGWRAEADFYSIIHGASVHMIDLVNWIVGKKPINVQTFGNKIVTYGGQQKYNDFASILLGYEDQMIVKISAHGGCVHPHFHSLKVFGENSTFIHETTGTVWVNSSNPNETFKIEKASYPSKESRGYALISFINSIIDKNKNALVSDEDVFTTVSICLAAEEALKKGQKINIEYL